MLGVQLVASGVHGPRQRLMNLIWNSSLQHEPLVATRCYVQDAWVKYYLDVIVQVDEALVAGGDEPLGQIRGKIQALAQWVLDGCLPAAPQHDTLADTGAVAEEELSKDVAAKAAGSSNVISVSDVQLNWTTPMQDPRASEQPYKHICGT